MTSPCPNCGGLGPSDIAPCPDCGEEPESGIEEARELYARDGTPCSTCTCSYLSMKPQAGTSPGFDLGAGLTLRICRIGREPLVAEGGTDELWCSDYAPFASLVPLQGDALEALQEDCSRGFLGDLANGLRPLPRGPQDLRWYDRGLREGWLPPHRVEQSSLQQGTSLQGPWQQFHVVGVTPGFGDGHTPAVGEPILQLRAERTYLLPQDLGSKQVSGTSQGHRWWVSQVSSGAAIPLEAPIAALRNHHLLVLRGGEQVLSPHAYRYLEPGQIEAALDGIAEESLSSARSAANRGNAVVVRICATRGLRARPQHEELRALVEALG